MLNDNMTCTDQKSANKTEVNYSHNAHYQHYQHYLRQNLHTHW